MWILCHINNCFGPRMTHNIFKIVRNVLLDIQVSWINYTYFAWLNEFHIYFPLLSIYFKIVCNYSKSFCSRLKNDLFYVLFIVQIATINQVHYSEYNLLNLVDKCGNVLIGKRAASCHFTKIAFWVVIHSNEKLMVHPRFDHDLLRWMCWKEIRWKSRLP